MRVLALGTLGLVAGCGPAGQWRHIRLRKYVVGDGRPEDVRAPATVLWRSPAARDACLEAMRSTEAAADRATQAGDRAAEASARRDVNEAFFSSRIRPCAEGSVLGLRNNEQVEILPDPGACAPKMVRVRVEKTRDMRTDEPSESFGCVLPGEISEGPGGLERGRWVLVIPVAPAGGADGSKRVWKRMEPTYETDLACQEHRLVMARYVRENNGGAEAEQAINHGRCLQDDDPLVSSATH